MGTSELPDNEIWYSGIHIRGVTKYRFDGNRLVYCTYVKAGDKYYVREFDGSWGYNEIWTNKQEKIPEDVREIFEAEIHGEIERQRLDGKFEDYVDKENFMDRDPGIFAPLEHL